MRDPASFPWRPLMACAFARAGIAPDLFWRLTPGELACVLAPFLPAEDAAMTRDIFNALHKRYPDPHA